MTVILGLFKSLFLLNIFLCLFTVSLISHEIHSEIENMYLAKIENRLRLIMSKLSALFILAAILMVIILISAAVGWQLFIRNSEFGLNSFLSANHDENFTLIFYILTSFFEVLVMISIFTLLSLFLNQGKAVAISFVVIIVFKLLNNMKEIKSYVPTYLGECTFLYDLSGSRLIEKGIYSMIILLIYTFIISGIIFYRYKKMDMIR